MRWDEVRTAYPDRWLVIETKGGIEIVDVVAADDDGTSVLRKYRELHAQQPERPLYFIHTGRAALQIF